MNSPYELTAEELEMRRDALSAYLVTLQEQCEEKRTSHYRKVGG